MNEYREKSSQLITLQTQDTKEQSQSNRLYDEESSLNLEDQEIETKIQELEKQKELKNTNSCKFERTRTRTYYNIWFIYWGIKRI